jgi:hypothetical protein
METKVTDETALPTHPVLLDPRTGKPLQALGIIRNRVVWPTLGAAETEGGEGDESADDPTDTDTDAEAEEGSGGESKKPGEKAKSQETVSLARFRKLERHLSEADKKRTAAETELAKLRDKDLPAVEKAERDRAEAVTRAEKAEASRTELARKYAFLLETQRQKVAWKNPAAALRLADLEELEVDDKGKVDGIEELVKNLVSEHTYLVEKASIEEEGGDGEDGKTKSRPKSGSPVGSRAKGKPAEGTFSDEDLRKRFPALRR